MNPKHQLLIYSFSILYFIALPTQTANANKSLSFDSYTSNKGINTANKSNSLATTYHDIGGQYYYDSDSDSDSKYDSAFHYYQLAAQTRVCIDSTSRYDLARSLYMMANIQHKNFNNYSLALEYITQTIDLLKEIGYSDWLLGNSLMTKAILYTEKRDYNQAITYLKTIEPYIEKDSLATIYHDIGGRYYNLEHKYDSAFYYYQLAEQTRVYTDSTSGYNLARSLYMMSNIQNTEFNNYPLALEYITQTIDLLKEIGYSDWLLGRSLITRAILYTEKGDYDQALTYLKTAKPYIEKDSFEIYRNKISLGQIYNQLKKYELALKEYDDCKNIIEALGIEDHINEYANVFLDIGLLELGRENYAVAEASLLEALSYYKQNKVPDNNNIAKNHTFLGKTYLESDQYYKAISELLTGLDIGMQHFPSPYNPIIAEQYYYLGECYAAQKNYPFALDKFQKGIKTLLPTFEPTNLAENPILSQHNTMDKESLRKALYLKAKTYQQKYTDSNELEDLEIALDTYLTLDTLITQIRQGFKSVKSKYVLQEKIIPIYEQAITVAHQLYELTDDTEYLKIENRLISANKAVILVEGLQDEKVKFATIPADWLAEEEDLKKAINKTEYDLYYASQDTTTSLESISQLEAELRDKKISYEKLIQTFESDYPQYYEQKHNYYPKLNIEDVQNQLDSNRAVVEFFVGEQNIFISVIAKNHFKVHQTPMPDNFKENCNTFMQMTRGESIYEPLFRDIAHQLYCDLFQTPLATLSDDITRLTIIPDDILLQMPFDNLLTAPFNINPDNWNSTDIPYLIWEYALSQVYANHLLFNELDQSRIDKASKSYAGFGIEYYDTSKPDFSKRDSTSNRSDDDKIMGNLPYSDDEVRAVQKIVGGDILINQDATKDNFITYAPKSEIIHMAGHAYMDEKDPLYSALVFYKPNKSADNLLRVLDLYDMKLNAKLSILSACQTGLGPVQRGEGMRSISRSFAYAGCPTLIASKGNIPDQSTKDVLTVTLEKLKEGMPIDVAMQQGKWAYFCAVDDPNQALPNRWGQTVIIGNVKPINIENPNEQRQASWMFIVTMIFLLVPLSLIINKNRKV